MLLVPAPQSHKSDFFCMWVLNIPHLLLSQSFYLEIPKVALGGRVS